MSVIGIGRSFHRSIILFFPPPPPPSLSFSPASVSGNTSTRKIDMETCLYASAAAINYYLLGAALLRPVAAISINFSLLNGDG